MTTPTPSRLHHAAAEAATLIANTGRGTKREGDVLADLRAALEADTLPAGPWSAKHVHGKPDEEFWAVVVCDESGEPIDEACLASSEGAARRIADDMNRCEAWREAVTAERLDALEQLMTTYRPNEALTEGHVAIECRELLTALRAVLAGEGAGV